MSKLLDKSTRIAALENLAKIFFVATIRRWKYAGRENDAP
jgi:hypothetical protein